MKYFKSWGLLGAVLLISSVSLLVYEHREQGPPLSVAPSRFQELRNVEPGSPIVWAFTLRNHCLESRRVSVIGKSCSCLNVTVGSEVIDVGAESVIEIRTSMPLVGEFSGSVYIEAANERFALSFAASPPVLSGLQAAPNVIRFAAGDGSTSFSSQHDLLLTLPKSAVLDASDLTVVCDKAGADVETILPWRRVSSLTWTCKVSVSGARELLRDCKEMDLKLPNLGYNVTIKANQ